jgi:predicted PurR-regulated permease PerM
MDEQKQSTWMTAFSIGALVGALAGILALLAQRMRRRTTPEDLTETIETNLQAPVQGAVYSPVQERSISHSRSVRNAPAAGAQAASIGSASPTGPDPASGPRWSTPTKYIMGVILFLVGLGVLFIGRGVIPIVILAALLALFINPLIQLLHLRFRLKWTTAVTLTYILVVLLLLLIPLLLLPNLISGVNFLLSQDYQALADQVAQAIASVSAALQGNPLAGSVLIPILDAVAAALQNFSTQGTPSINGVTITISGLTRQLVGTLGALVNILGPVVSVVLSAVFTLLMALQMSLAANKIQGWYPDLIPPAYKGEYGALFDKITGSWVAFLRGQLTLMLVIGLMTYVGNLILGVPSALLLAVIAGLLELIPSVGPTLAAIPAVLVALFFGSTHLAVGNIVFALLVLGLYVLIQFLENQFLVPYIMGDAVDLPPLIVLIGTLAGATAFGILGALLATPIIATGNLIFQFVYRKILEPPPSPPPPEEKSIWDSVKGWVGRLPLPGRKKEASKPRPDKPAQPTAKTGASSLTEIEAPAPMSVDSRAERIRSAAETKPPVEITPPQAPDA